MNTHLELLFEKYDISAKNRHEISQIYNLLSDDKKQNVINNFERLSINIDKIEWSINLEKEILIGWAVERIRNTILENRKEKINLKIEKEMSILKGNI